MNLTKIGFEDLKRRITSRVIDPPNNLTAEELMNWLNGYAKCQHDILDVIDEMGKRTE